MKKSSKIISLALSVTMAASCFTGFSICSASAADDETKIYFEVPTLESWGTTKSVFCHVYNVYGGTPLKETAWQSKSENCKKDAATGLYYFDTTKVGTIEEGADYALLFSTKDTDGASHQTGNITFAKECLGDVVYVTGGMVENTEDSSKMDFEGAWKNHSDKYGAKAAITSTGKIVGKYFPVYQPKEQIVAQYLASWTVTNAESEEGKVTAEKLANICSELGVKPEDVLAQYKADYAEQLADPENNPSIASVETVAALLGVDPNPTTEPATTEPATDPEPQLLYGDVDQDGVISVQDATMIQKIGVGLIDEPTTEEEMEKLLLACMLADVNSDGRISILDVTYIQKYLAGGYQNTGLVGTAVEAVG